MSFLGKMNIVARGYFYTMWFVGTPVMIAFILGNTFKSYQTIGEMYGYDNPDDGLPEIYPQWSNTLGNWKLFFLCVNSIFYI